MDAFLRRVVEQREREQEARLLFTPVSELIPNDCRVCDGPITMAEQGGEPTVCGKCGGRKMQLKLEAKDRREAAKRQRRQNLFNIWESKRAAKRNAGTLVPALREALEGGQQPGRVLGVSGERREAEGGEHNRERDEGEALGEEALHDHH